MTARERGSTIKLDGVEIRTKCGHSFATCHTDHCFRDPAPEISDQSELVTMAVAALAVGLIRENPELITRLREYAADQKAPFPVDNLDEHALLLTDLAMSAIALKLAELRRHAGHPHVALPMFRDNMEMNNQATGAMALASYALEYLHSEPEMGRAFGRWWDSSHPGETGQVTLGKIEAADEMVTMLTAMFMDVAEKLAGKQPEPEPDDGSERIDLSNAPRFY